MDRVRAVRAAQLSEPPRYVLRCAHASRHLPLGCASWSIRVLIHQAAAGRWTAASKAVNVVKAISLKVMSAFLFAAMSALVRYLGERYPVRQIVFFRSAFAILPVMLIYAWRNELAE